MAFNRDNHYVPCLYLKRFSSSPGYIQTYRILVADSRVPVWKPIPIKGIAYRAHLYTRIASGVESDEIEKWLNEEFEAPADEVIGKATTGARLTRDDWRSLVRFLAAQDVRTPARLIETLRRFDNALPGILQDTLEKTVRQLEAAKKSGTRIGPVKATDSDYIPVRLTREIEPGQKFGQLKSEVVAGRGLWLYTIRYILKNTAEILHKQRWSILSPPMVYVGLRAMIR
jgi:hypothetical protein